MKGRYAGARMSTYGSVIPGASRLAGVGVELSKEAEQRLKWMDYYETHGRNASLTCRYFGISRKTFYKWRARYTPRDLVSLESRSRRPKRVRRPTWSAALVAAVQALREQYPRWGKDKLVVVLAARGVRRSVSMVGRILAWLKRTGQLVEPVRRISARKRASSSSSANGLVR